LADEERRRERSRMIKKYHFVRFLGMLPSLRLIYLDLFIVRAGWSWY
jgi:hypothetical protein